MINHKHKFYFIHIPRTGGTTIQDYFNHYPTPPYQDEQDREIDHYRLIDYEKQQDFNPTYFKFCFVRNIWERLVSVFFLKKYGTNRWPGIDRRLIDCENLDFSDFIYKLAEIDFNKVPHSQSSHLLPQTEYIRGGVSKLDFIGRFENFRDDFDHICNEIGISSQKLGHENKSNHKYYTEYYSSETKDIVAHKYAEDIEFFKHRFE